MYNLLRRAAGESRDERQRKEEMSDRQQHKQATESNIKGQTTAEEMGKQSA